MFWLRNSDLKTLKKYRKGVFCDDTVYDFDRWAQEMSVLESVINLRKAGHDYYVYNPLIFAKERIIDIKLQWHSVTAKVNGKQVGRIFGGYVGSFIIVTEGKFQFSETITKLNSYENM